MKNLVNKFYKNLDIKTLKKTRLFVVHRVTEITSQFSKSLVSILAKIEKNIAKNNLETFTEFITKEITIINSFVLKAYKSTRNYIRAIFNNKNFENIRDKIYLTIAYTIIFVVKGYKALLNFFQVKIKIKSQSSLPSTFLGLIDKKSRKSTRTISILVPCHNEEKSIAACVQSCLNQTRKADQILVVNDGSTDRSLEVLSSFGNKIQILNIPVATGNKSHAQEIGLKHINGDIFFATDGDTILDIHMIEEMEKSFDEDPNVVAVGGYVKSLKYNWLTACRELDYIIGQNLHKVAQEYIDAVFVIPGCAGAFRTDIFKEYIRFDHDTLTEDLDFTYKLHKNYFRIAYNRNAIAYTQDPATIPQYINQMRRWYSGGWQNLRKHYSVISKPNNSLQLSLTYFEGLVFSFAIFAFPIINIKFFFFFIIPYFGFLVLLGIYSSYTRKRLDLLLYSPTYIILVFINSYIFLEQFWKEIILGKTSLVWFHPDRREINSQ